MVEQPPRRGDDDVNAASERMLLRSHPDATEHGRTGDRRMDGERGEIFENLRRQLTCRREHQGSRGTPRLVDQAMQNRQQKRRRFAAACLGAANDVLSLHGRRNRFGLNGGRPDEAKFLDALKK